MQKITAANGDRFRLRLLVKGDQLSISLCLQRFHDFCPVRNRGNRALAGNSDGRCLGAHPQHLLHGKTLCQTGQEVTGEGITGCSGIHCLDLIEYITGSRIVKVGALSDNMTFSYEVEDACSALFKLDCGAFGTVDANFNIPDDAARCRIEIYGTKGSIRAEGTIGQMDGGDVLVTLSDTKGYDAMQERSESNDYKMTGADGNMYAREVASFGDSILNGSAVEVHAENAVHIQKVIEAIYKSSETGEFINL